MRDVVTCVLPSRLQDAQQEGAAHETEDGHAREAHVAPDDARVPVLEQAIDDARLRNNGGVCESCKWVRVTAWGAHECADEGDVDEGVDERAAHALRRGVARLTHTAARVRGAAQRRHSASSAPHLLSVVHRSQRGAAPARRGRQEAHQQHRERHPNRGRKSVSAHRGAASPQPLQRRSAAHVMDTGVITAVSSSPYASSTDGASADSAARATAPSPRPAPSAPLPAPASPPASPPRCRGAGSASSSASSASPCISGARLTQRRLRRTRGRARSQHAGRLATCA